VLALNLANLTPRSPNKIPQPPCLFKVQRHTLHNIIAKEAENGYEHSDGEDQKMDLPQDDDANTQFDHLDQLDRDEYLRNALNHLFRSRTIELLNQYKICDENSIRATELSDYTVEKKADRA